MKMMNAVCYSFSLGFQDAMAHLRLIAPLNQVGIHIINGIKNGQPAAELVLDGDIVIVQQDFPRNFDDYQKVMEIAKRERKPVVFDLDDLLLFLPENHPDRVARYYAPSLLPMFQALMEADLVTVATPGLQSLLAGYNKNVVVLPNYFDDALWKLRPPALKSKDEMLTIGYMGGNSHKPDIEYILPVLLDLIKRYPHKLRFQFWGLQPPAELLTLPQVEWMPYYSSLYKDFSAFFQTQSADIFIAPLVDTLFNRCKSPLKFFEYSALGVPGVFSHLETFSGVVSHGKNGLLASSLDEWTDCLMQLIENDELRFQLAASAQASIKENWLLSRNAFHWEETLKNAFEIMNSNKEQDAHIVSGLRFINFQSFEAFKALSNRVAAAEQSMQALTAQVAEKEQSVQALNAQAAEKERSIQALSGQLREITISKAWRVAMLFRRARLWLAPPGSWRARPLRRMLSLIIFPFQYGKKLRIAIDLALIRASDRYDPQWYLANNLDVAQAGMDPARHYLLFGGFEGRDPGPSFSSERYLAAHPDVLAARINPLIHYLKYGQKKALQTFVNEFASPFNGESVQDPLVSVIVPVLINLILQSIVFFRPGIVET